MGFSLSLALRYMRSRKRAFISVSTIFAIAGVALGTAALATVMSVTGGFRAEFRDKVLGVNAHVLVLKYSSEFREYREVMAKVRQLPEVIGIGPFVINPMMVTHAGHTATGVLVKGVDPGLMGTVLDLPRHMVEGSLEGNRLETSVGHALQGREDPLRTSMGLGRVQPLEARVSEGLRIVAIGADLEQPPLAVDRRDDPAMTHAEAAEAQRLARRLPVRHERTSSSSPKASADPSSKRATEPRPSPGRGGARVAA